MGIRAKMKVESKTAIPESQGWAVVLRPVVGGSPENDEFFRYTPGGQFNLQTINDAAAAQLEVGQEAYIDITPIPRDLSPAPEATSAPAAESAPVDAPATDAAGETAPAAE